MKVLLLHASALHLGFIGCYGNAWIDTPNMDRLAAEGIVFDLHYADRIGQRTSWTGQCRSQEAQLQHLLPSCGVPLVHVACPDSRGKQQSTPLELTLDRAAEALQELSDRPDWLCWVDLPSLQPPWQAAEVFAKQYLAPEIAEEEQDEPFDALPDPPIGPLDADDLVLWERLRCTYAGEVAYLDAGLGLLFDELKKSDQFDHLTIILTSDRGLALGEHGIVGDWRPWLHDEVVHIPLIVRQPEAKGAGRHVFSLTQSADVAATLREWCGERTPCENGRSLSPLLDGRTDAIRDHCISAWELDECKEWSLRTLHHALILPVEQTDDANPRPTQFYLKPEDRWEVNNVIQHHLELAEELERTLRAEV